MSNKNFNQPYRRNIMMNNKEINLDNQLWNAQLNELVDFVFTDQIKALEIPNYIPTREEIIQIVKYWIKEVLEVQYYQFVTGAHSGSDWRLISFARNQGDHITEVLGIEAMDQAINEVYAKFGEKQEKRIWNIFLNGTKEQRDAVVDEFQGEWKMEEVNYER